MAGRVDGEWVHLSSRWCQAARDARATRDMGECRGCGSEMTPQALNDGFITTDAGGRWWHYMCLRDQRELDEHMNAMERRAYRNLDALGIQH